MVHSSSRHWHGAGASCSAKHLKRQVQPPRGPCAFFFVLPHMTSDPRLLHSWFGAGLRCSHSTVLFHSQFVLFHFASLSAAVLCCLVNCHTTPITSQVTRLLRSTSRGSAKQCGQQRGGGCAGEPAVDGRLVCTAVQLPAKQLPPVTLLAPLPHPMPPCLHPLPLRRQVWQNCRRRTAMGERS